MPAAGRQLQGTVPRPAPRSAVPSEPGPFHSLNVGKGRGKGKGKGGGGGRGRGAKGGSGGGKGGGGKGGGGKSVGGSGVGGSRGVGGKARGRGGRGSFWASLPEAEKARRRARKRYRLKRRSSFIGQPCVSAYHDQGDKKSEDCEDWCDESKIGHCRYCKCRGCKHCHGDLSLPDWIFGADASLQCSAFGLCANGTVTYPLCLSVWKGEIHDGAPLVWARCRNDVYAHQQWHKVGLRANGDDVDARERGDDERGEGLGTAPFMLQLGARPPQGGGGVAESGHNPSHGPFCAAVPMPMSLLA